jgi:DNA-binding transcriptional MerR regulator
MQTKRTIFSTGEVARLLGVQAYRVTYAHATGQVAEPSRLFGGRRAYSLSDLKLLAKHFNVQLLDPALTGAEKEEDE